MEQALINALRDSRRQQMQHQPMAETSPEGQAGFDYFNRVLSGDIAMEGINEMGDALTSGDPERMLDYLGAGAVGSVAFKNPNVRKAMGFWNDADIAPTNPTTGLSIDPTAMTASDRIAMDTYGKSLENPAFKAREEMAMAGGRESVVTGELIDHLRKPLDLGDLEGRVMVPLMSDLTTRGGVIESVGGLPLSRRVMTEGGAGFAADPKNIERGVGYASTSGAAQGIQNRLTNAAEKTGLDPVYMWGAMGPDSFDFAHFPMEAVIDQMETLRPYMSKEMLREFDADVRALAKPRPKGKAPYPKAGEWVGWDAPEAADQLLGRGDYGVAGAGAMRKAVMDRLKTAKYQNLGMPDYAALRGAVSDPRFRDIGVGDTGAVAIAGKPGAPLVDVAHGTYPKGMQGEYLGGLETLVPGGTMWKDILHGGEYKPNRHRALSTNMSYQIMTPEILDNVARIQALRGR